MNKKHSKTLSDFDKYLKGQSSELLDEGGKKYEEVGVLSWEGEHAK